MAEVNNSLRALTQRLPARPFQLPRGNYAENVLYAQFVELGNDDELTPASFLPAEPVNILLFTQDVPVRTSAVSTYAASFYGADPKPSNLTFEELAYEVQEFAAGTEIVVDRGVFSAPGDEPEIGEGAVCTLATSGAVVRGYLAYTIIPDRSLVKEAAGTDRATARLQIEVVTESGVAAGQATIATVVTDNTFNTGRRPVILRASDYTEEMQANDNVYVDDDGVVSVIVGVYELVNT